MKRLVMGILAHVDSGKTTLSEAMLYRTGEIRRLGRVDHGDAFLDTDVQERERGITIFSKQAELRLRHLEITLLDTPGHVDFSAETERTLQVLDAAVLVVSATDGVQSHTETLWKLLERYGIPVFLFINKIDLAGADVARVRAQLKARLSENCVFLEEAISAETVCEELAEELALCDETLMELFLQGKKGDGPAYDAALCAAVSSRRVFPCLSGSALKCEGVEELLSALERWAPAPQYPEEFSARVYKISQDEQGARLTHMKITGGSLKVRAGLTGQDADGDWSEKVSQLRVYSGSRYRAVEEVPAGTVCAVLGLTRTFPGQGLGAEKTGLAPVLEPVLTYRVEPAENVDIPTALGVLRRLEQEEPQLHVVWNETLGEIHVQLMGEVQLEVLGRLLELRGLPVRFGQGSILYRETIARPVEGIGHYEPLRHYAEVHLLLEPGEPGSGLQFATACREDDLDKNWQRLILTHLREKTHLGVLTGAPITDLKITLLAGRAHPKHTEGGDFRQATYRAVRQGLRSTESVLLEPWYAFRLEVPAENVGRALTDLERLGAQTQAPQPQGQTTLLAGSAPVASLRDYSAQVLGYTRGRGRLVCTPQGYRPCHNAEEVIAAAAYRPDADTENTADSVFCAHGAGFNVKWNEVRRYMHVDTGWGKRAVQPLETARAPVSAAAARYRGTLEEDKELLAIFERTYGPIRRKAETFFRPVQPALKAEAAPPPLPQSGDYLLVDGYNILFAWEDLHALAQENLEAARHRLMDILCNYHGWHGGELILVFDAYRVKGSPGSVEEYHGIHVVYTKEAETADMYIEKTTHQLGRSNRVRVATSDGLEQLIILGHGALRLSASAFREEVDAALAAIRECLSS